MFRRRSQEGRGAGGEMNGFLIMTARFTTARMAAIHSVCPQRFSEVFPIRPGAVASFKRPKKRQAHVFLHRLHTDQRSPRLPLPILFIQKSKTCPAIAGRRSKAKRISGGIERFKEGLHGNSLDRVGMIAFIQKNDLKHWLAEINGWINDLIHSPPLKSHQVRWPESDWVHEAAVETLGVAELRSVHERRLLPQIRITHFWLML